MSMFEHVLSVAETEPYWLQMAAIGVAVVSYVLGCLNGAVIISRFVLMDDVRDHGSGNAGLTNFLRVFGGLPTILVICIDLAKAILSVSFSMYIASLISIQLLPLAKYWAALFCLLGHMFPAPFGFRGGKGILSGGMIAILIGFSGGGELPGWIIPVTVWGGFLILVIATRYVSLGSCWAGFSFPVVSALVFQDTLILIISLIIGTLILWKHRTNIKRLLHGTESKLSFGRKPRPEKPADPPRPARADEKADIPQPQPEQAPAPAETPAPAPAEMPAPAPAETSADPGSQGKKGGKKGKSKGKQSGKGRK